MQGLLSLVRPGWHICVSSVIMKAALQRQKAMWVPGAAAPPAGLKAALHLLRAGPPLSAFTRVTLFHKLLGKTLKPPAAEIRKLQPVGRCGPLPVFINKDLLMHSHSHLLTPSTAAFWLQRWT